MAHTHRAGTAHVHMPTLAVSLSTIRRSYSAATSLHVFLSKTCAGRTCRRRAAGVGGALGGRYAGCFGGAEMWGTLWS